jgi:LPS-assembly protein
MRFVCFYSALLFSVSHSAIALAQNASAQTSSYGAITVFGFDDIPVRQADPVQVLQPQSDFAPVPAPVVMAQRAPENDGAPRSYESGAVSVYSLDDPYPSASSQPVASNGADISGSQAGDSAPVDFQAAQLDYDEVNNIVTATGDVFLEQEGRLLRADRVVYDLNADRVKAYGHVVLNDINGDIHYAEEVELTDKMKDGVIHELLSYMEDGSQFAAVEGQRIGGVKTVMNDASYTACEPCKAHPEKAPVWQITADKVTHDEIAKRVSYEDATFEVKGVPVAYLPYFSHADPSVTQKSGFLTPSAGFKSDQGFFAESSYYWGIAPDQDMTVGLIGFTQENPLLRTQWRKRWNRASIEFNGGVTYSGRTDSESGINLKQDEEIRGHVLANALWDVNDKWRVGSDVQWASDDQYMRQYDFVNEDVLTSEVYAERFNERDYFAARALTFQDVRVGDLREDQPEILPEIVASYKGDSGAVPFIGGQWSVDSSYLGLRREGNEQDYDRISLGGAWDRHFVSDTGLVTDVELAARHEIYHIRDRESATPGSGRSREATDMRFYPQAQLMTSYPLAKEFENGVQMRLEPVASVTVAPDIDVINKIPNEDSQDVQLDAHNLFNRSRFPGIDRVEDQSRVTYGFRSGLYNGGISEIRTFLGQSYRLDEEDNPFPDGSGLSTQSSDIVGEIAGFYLNNYSLNYRFQLDSQDLSSRRHEVDAAAEFGRLSLGTRYLFAKSLDGTDIDESREQVRLDTGYYWNDDWQSVAGFTQDLGAEPGLRQAYVGLNYFGQCLFWSLTGQRNLTDDSSGESDVEILFRVGLKNLGEFQESRFSDN